MSNDCFDKKLLGTLKKVTETSKNNFSSEEVPEFNLVEAEIVNDISKRPWLNP